MKFYSDLGQRFHWSKATKNRHSRPYKVALLAALLSCSSMGAFGAKAHQLSKVSCGSNSFNGAGSDACSVYLTATTASDVSVRLSSNNSSVKVPITVYIKAGKSTGGFTAKVSSVTTKQTATITAALNGSTRTYAIQLNPSTSTPAPSLSSLTCSSSSMTGAGSVTCTPTLTGAAPTGGMSVSLSSSSGTVTVPGSVTVAAGATSASFAATVSSFTTAQTVTLTATAGGASKTFALKLTPSTPTLTINATSISFGSVVVGSQATQTVTLTSSGTAAVTVNSAAVSGTGFSVSGSSFPVTLNPGQTLNLSVQFAPKSSGSVTGQLAIANTSSTNPTANVALSGTGSPHQVDLSWAAPSSSSDPIAGYNVYRAAGSSAYQMVNSSLISPTTYADSTVTSGQTYSYMVKSVGSSGTESSPSNTTTVTIP